MNRRIILGGGIAVVLIAVIGVVWLNAAPAIGPTAASPAYVVINVPTQVLITANITDASVIPSGVNLLKVDGSGKTLAVLGTMRDDGLNGDGVAGDKTFSLRTTVTEPSVGQIRLQVSAAFRGVLKRVLSVPIVVTIDPIPLPPDPGEAGKETLAGIDSDSDGVRDDLQRYIQVNYFGSPAIAETMTEISIGLQGVINSAEASAVPAVTRNVNAVRCLTHLTHATTADELFTDLRARALNTKARSARYAQVINASSAYQFGAPRRGDLAQFCSD
jgi:hypothetical protein